MALPIPQEIPDAEDSARTIPGIESKKLPALPPKQMARKPAFRTPVYSRVSSGAGMFYGMEMDGMQGIVPTVPIAVRSSLAQTIRVFRVQASHYFYMLARATRFPGMAPGYPIAKVLTLINTAPRMAVNARAVRGSTGMPARSGYMNAPPRFTKALPAPINQYEPPTYGS